MNGRCLLPSKELGQTPGSTYMKALSISSPRPAAYADIADDSSDWSDELGLPSAARSGAVVELRPEDVSQPNHPSCIATPVRQRAFFVLGSAVCALVALAQGLLLPNPPAIPHPWNRVSAVVGWLYFWAWSVSFYPQVGSLHPRPPHSMRCTTVHAD